MNTILTPSAVDFVSALEIAPLSREISELLGGRQLSDAGPSDAPAASIDAGSLVAFTANVSAQHKSDALNSTLLAQLAANKQFSRFDKSQIMNWYKTYTDVLGKIGWDIQSFQFQNYQASGSTFSIDTAIAGIVASFLPADQVSVVKAALTALSNLGNDDPWYKVWDSSSHSADGGNFQICSCGDANGAANSLVLKVSAYAFQTTETSTRFLWTSYNSSSTTLQYSTQSATLDEDIYSQVRTQVIAKLGANAAASIDNIQI